MKTFTDEDFKLLLEEMILADLKHSQLLFGLAALGLDHMDNHYLVIHDLIAKLMGIATDSEKDRSTEIYMDYMQQSMQFPFSPRGEELRSLSKACLDKLLADMD